MRLRTMALQVAIIVTLFIVLYGSTTNEPPQKMRVSEDAIVSLDTTYVEAPVTTTGENTIDEPIPPNIEVTESTPRKEAAMPEVSEPPTPPTSEPRYSFSPLSLENELEAFKKSIVNILCIGGPPFRSTSGSGVIIDPKGIILTNAHIGQYLLLAENPAYNITCTIRTGSPARSLWGASVLFMPEIWVKDHAHDILESKARGTGEHDYALLQIVSTDNGKLENSLPFIKIEIREPSSVVGDTVLLLAYPAEFIGGSAVRDDLYTIAVISVIKDVYTFIADTVDVLSLGNVPLAQGGASGGAVINTWGYLTGLISTTSEGSTTGLRDLRATSLSHIERSFREHTGLSLHQYLHATDSFPSIKIKNEELGRFFAEIIEKKLK